MNLYNIVPAVALLPWIGWSYYGALQQRTWGRHITFGVILGLQIIAGEPIMIQCACLLMVGLGLTGVMWQTVTQRTREMGLRRANGAAARQVRSQIMLELTLMTSLAVLAGVAVVVQVPMLELIGGVSGAAYVAGLAISAAAIYLLTILCGWYPSRLASQIPPAEALRYE